MDIIREDCIYARQSVDRKDSISIESQIDFCKYELKGGSCKVFKDKGYSGKNTDRPEFQKLLGEIRKGRVRRVIVYKLDRISRSILDFANMMELFQEYDVEFVSSTEKFDTSTPMGRAMLNICIVFAQLERETIQKRVTDAYYSRCLKGFHMSGQAPYGYQLEPTVVEGIRTKKMVADPETSQYVKLMFEMYSEPETSFGDITRYFEEQNIDTLKSDSELYLVIYAGFAQSESESISKNITWTHRKNFEEGRPIFMYSRMLGYKKGADGNPEIVPSEAAIVQRVFDMYLSGKSTDEISEILQGENIEIPGKKLNFSKSMIIRMLKNEKYCGDAILQKTVTLDPISKKRKANEGEAPRRK